MCGFAGILRWQGLAQGDDALVARAADSLAHRGPDSSGFWRDSHVALGFRRLKIIDLSPHGEQPMANEDGTLQIVFNGEIYNYRELRDQLRGLGHTFRSSSDTEVLLHGFEQFGEELLPKLRGMFSFAIWNIRERKLFLARDPLGVKPLYVAESADGIVFASEAKAILQLGFEKRLDAVAIDEALTYRYVPPPRSGFQNIEKLPPGNLAWAENGMFRYRRWWAIPANEEAIDASAAQKRAEELLHQATQRRTIADVPIGAWLSGGIDSGLVRANLDKSFHSFCAGFADPEYDERELARMTAAHLQSEHTDFEVPADVFRFLPQIIWHADEPFFDSSSLPVYVLARETKRYATVVFSGDGGDESFGGYDRYVGMQLLARYKNTPQLFRRLALKYADWKYPAATRQGWDRMLRWLEKCRSMEDSGHHPYLAAMELFNTAQKKELYGDQMLDATDGCDAREYLEGALLRARCSDANEKKLAPGVLQRADTETYLSGDVLHKVDRMSMAHGVEVRSPFLDVDLVSFALSLPDRVRLPGRETKPILRRAAARALPDAVVHARKKGFGVPLDNWFRGPLKEIGTDVFENSKLVSDKLLKPRFWEALWNEHQQQRAQHGERLYALLALEFWYRTFFMGSAPAGAPKPL